MWTYKNVFFLDRRLLVLGMVVSKLYPNRKLTWEISHKIKWFIFIYLICLFCLHVCFETECYYVALVGLEEFVVLR